MVTMDKTGVLQAILERLSHDLDVLFGAAKTAHEAATHPENAPADKYDTLALEASYVAQGQANRASQIRQSIELYRQLRLPAAPATVQLAALVTLEDAAGAIKKLFIGPAEGGLKIEYLGEEVVVITPASPMGRELLGRSAGDTVVIEAGANLLEYEIVELC
jgi:transcription elongation GreA/GreB family factor